MSDAGRGSRLGGPRLAGAVGNMVEWYEFAVFGASATLVAGALTPGDSGLTAVFAVFAVALLARPVGAVLGAVWADHAGRRTPLLASILAMTVATVAIGLLPSWSVAGGVVVLALVVLRIVQGLSSGAELVVSVAYLAEHAPVGRRGLWGGLHMATLAVGFAVGMGAVSAVSFALSPSAVQSWGWRLPFLLALPLGAAAFTLRRLAIETPDYAGLRAHGGGSGGGARWRLLLRRPGRVAQAFVLTSGLMCSFTLWFVHLPAHLASTRVVALHTALGSSIAGLVAMSVSAVVCGHVSDHQGRRPLILGGLALTAITWGVGYPLVLEGSTSAMLVANLAAGTGLGALLVQSTLGEAFPLHLRTAGLALGFSLASALVGGTAPLVADRLVRLGPWPVVLYAVAWLAGAALAAVPLTRLAPVDRAPGPPVAVRPG
ncbi:MAG TPA: MFS transporter [Dermatophilaceae bacterium]|nr:MFS transporter [Dermatophilaceae bacterium]